MKLVAAIFLLGAAGNGFAHASDLRGREFIGYGSFESFATNNSPGSEAMVLVSPVVQSQIRFDEAIVSWTAKAGPDAFLTVTLAFATVAPEGSLTNPEILPRSDCASSAPASKRQRHTTTADIDAVFFIDHPVF